MNFPGETEEEMVITTEELVESAEVDQMRIESFDQLDINRLLLRAIFAYGFEKPSAIQMRAIKPMLSGRDTIAQAQSGTGKTATFAISALGRVDFTEKRKGVQVIILSPTRELAQQTANVVNAFGGLIGAVVQTVVGGNRIEDDAREYRSKPPHIISACPGRLFDLLKRGLVDSRLLKMLIMDEADEMLSSGFRDQIIAIFSGHISSEVQVVLVSATLPAEIHQVADEFMKNPLRILVRSEQLTLEGITQFFVATENDQIKMDTVLDLFAKLTIGQAIIYLNSVNRVEDLLKSLVKTGFPAIGIHSKMELSDRKKAFDQFKSGAARILISTNVTARGIDVQAVSIVINFDIPSKESYLHRIGRSGRWGRKGLAINFVTPRDSETMSQIEQFYETQINELPMDYADMFNSKP